MKWGVVLAVLVIGYIIMIPIFKKINYLISWERKRDIAVQRNHIIEATLIDEWRSGDDGKYYWHATYQYSIDGKQKKYRAIFTNPPNQTLHLYYLNNPKRPFAYNELRWENHKAIILLPIICLPWILAVAAVFVLNIEIPGM